MDRSEAGGDWLRLSGTICVAENVISQHDRASSLQKNIVS